MSITAEQVLKTHEDLVRHLQGSLDVEVDGVCSQDHPKKNAIAYIADDKHLAALLDSPISLLVVHEKMTGAVKELAKNKTVFTSLNTRLAMALINKKYFELPFLRAPFDGHKIHPSAVISEFAQLEKDVVVGPGAVISANVKVGRGTYIGANSVIEANSQIGEYCFIHALVCIGHSCQIGNRVEIKPHSVIGSDGYGYAQDNKGRHHKVPHYGPVIIEDDVNIGANVNVDRGTFESARIGSGTKIDNHVHLGHNIQVGKNCLLTAGLISAGSVKIGDNCVFGGRVSINGHIEIAANTVIGGLAGVNNDVTKPGAYGGWPLIDLKDSMRVQASLASLPRLRKEVSKILKHLGLKDGNT